MLIKAEKQEEYQEYVKRNSDGDYGQAVVHFAEIWAAVMECRRTYGQNIADIAEETSHLADHCMDQWGMSGFQFSCAAQSLVEFWEYGDELAKWYEKRFPS